MGEKQDIIKKLIDMQKMFIKYEQDNGVQMKDYFVAKDDHPLKGYRQEYADLANKLVDIAHEEKGSHR